MAKKAETKLKEQVFKKLKKEKIWIEKIQQQSIRGTPDVIGCIQCHLCSRGLFVAMELKDEENNDPDPLQEYKLEQIKKLGGISLVVREATDVDCLLSYLSTPSEEPKTLQSVMEYLIEQGHLKKK